jgi:DNA mismatch endonuclease (patch repair protein)
MSTEWRKEKAPEESWRPLAGLSREERANEQDIAAGGRENRVVSLTTGTAVGSICLRLIGRRIYAYLRWSEGGTTTEKYVTECLAANRRDNLSQAWSAARAKHLTEQRDGHTGRVVKPVASSTAIRAVMRGNRSRDTKPELALRRACHALGLRYRVGRRPIPGLRRTADLAFTSSRVAVFLDGCFWHGCPQHHRPSKRNANYWATKIRANQLRDSETDRALVAAGWLIVRVWEHEDPDVAAASIRSVVEARRAELKGPAEPALAG